MLPGATSQTSSPPPSGTYRGDRAWSDRFIPQIKAIVGPLLLSESPLEIDQKQAADLIVMRGRDMTIACRVRRYGYAEKYPFEFTIRKRRDNGCETELSKIKDGWGDWMFYGHSNAEQSSLSRWFLIDLSAWRSHLITNSAAIRQGEQPNGDGTYFQYYDLRSFSGNPSILIASSSGASVSESTVINGEMNSLFELQP